MKNITYGVDGETFYARCGDRIAFFELNYVDMKQENGFESTYKISEFNVLSVRAGTWDNIRWTKKIPLVIKNKFRKHFNLPELKMTPSYYLVIDIKSGKYLSGSDGDKNKYTSSLSRALKFEINNQFNFSGKIMWVEMG